MVCRKSSAGKSARGNGAHAVPPYIQTTLLTCARSRNNGAVTSDLKLNPEQKRAVEHGDGPLLIMAGPGSGKTRVISQRMVHLLQNADCSGALRAPDDQAEAALGRGGLCPPEGARSAPLLKQEQGQARGSGQAPTAARGGGMQLKTENAMQPWGRSAGMSPVLQLGQVMQSSPGRQLGRGRL